MGTDSYGGESVVYAGESGEDVAHLVDLEGVLGTRGKNVEEKLDGMTGIENF